MSKPETEIDHEYTEVPVCPYCGKKNHEWWDGHDGSEGWDSTCDRCEKEYRVSMMVSTDFTTTKPEVKV